VGDERLRAPLLLDDHSRFLVGHALTDSPSSAGVTATFRAAMARHGRPEAVRTDRGGGFVAFTKDGDFGRVLEAELVDHIVGRSYSTRGGGKIESAIGTLKREAVGVQSFARAVLGGSEAPTDGDRIHDHVGQPRANHFLDEDGGVGLACARLPRVPNVCVAASRGSERVAEICRVPAFHGTTRGADFARPGVVGT
jgi:hypothetical protein